METINSSDQLEKKEQGNSLIDSLNRLAKMNSKDKTAIWNYLSEDRDIALLVSSIRTDEKVDSGKNIDIKWLLEAKTWVYKMWTEDANQLKKNIIDLFNKMKLWVSDKILFWYSIWSVTENEAAKVCKLSNPNWWEIEVVIFKKTKTVKVTKDWQDIWVRKI